VKAGDIKRNAPNVGSQGVSGEWLASSAAATTHSRQISHETKASGTVCNTSSHSGSADTDTLALLKSVIFSDSLIGV